MNIIFIIMKLRRIPQGKKEHRSYKHTTNKSSQAERKARSHWQERCPWTMFPKCVMKKQKLHAKLSMELGGKLRSPLVNFTNMYKL